jgi:hypothetical protein
MRIITALLASLLAAVPASVQHKPVVGLIPKAQKPIAMDGKVTGWASAIVTPVVAAVKTPWGYTAEFKLPWANFPDFTPKAGEIVGIDCELCSSDGGPRVDRTFVYSSPAAVGSPSAFGQVQLVDRIDAGALKPYGRVLLPLSLTKSANYAWLYGTVCISPTIEGSLARLEGKLLDAGGKVRKTSTGSKRTLDGGFTLWTGSWEMFDLAPGIYALEVVASDKTGAVITSRTEKVLHGNPGSK